MNIGLHFGETLHSVKLVQVGDVENVYLLTKGIGELILLTEKNIETTATGLSKLTVRNMRNIDDEAISPSKREHKKK